MARHHAATSALEGHAMERGNARIKWSRITGLTLGLLLLAAPAWSAGNVQVGQVDPNGGLQINGDSSGNDVTVTQNPNGSITITGNGGTTVNGQPSVTTTAPVTGKLKVNLRGGDDKVTVDGVTKAGEIEIKDEIGKNQIKVKDTTTKGKLKIKNEDGKIELDDVSWGRRDIRPGKGTVDPPGAAGKGGAGSAPPKSSGGKKAATKKAPSKKAPLEAQQQGLPTTNPGQRGLIQDVPEVPHGPSVPSYPSTPSYPTTPSKSGPPKSKH
jgi:hypothetical protein